MRPPTRALVLALSVSLAITLAGLGGLSVQAVPAYSGPYVKASTTLGGGNGTTLGVATLRDDSILVASSLSNGTGVLDIMDNPGDNTSPNDDSLTFSSGVLGVASNQIDDTVYFVTDSSSVPAGVTWTARTSAAAGNRWRSIAWGGPTGQETFVAVAASGTGNRVMTSPDGITWTARTSAADNGWLSVAWGGPPGQETFVAVAASGTGNRVMTSPDGITWTARTSAADNPWESVVWGGPPGQEIFVAVATSGVGNRVMTSPDGITWTARTSAADNSWNSVTWGGPPGQETFVAVAINGVGNRVMTSPDGITWTSRSSAESNAWRSVTWGGPPGQETFVAVADTGTGNRVMTSPDGITWTARTSAADNDWLSVTWGGPTGQETFVAVAETGTGNRVMTSPDGITWTARTSAADNSWYSVTWGGPTGQETFVAVAINGGNQAAMTSAAAPAPAGGRATLRTYARGALDDSAPMPGTGVGGAWADIAVNSADDTVYVASQDDTRVIAFRGANLDDSRSILLPTGTTPYALAVNRADDTVYVLSYASGTTAYLTAMRGSNPDDSTTIPLSMVPGRQALAIHPTDDTIYVGGWNTVGKVEAYSPNLTFTDVASIGLGPTVSGLAVSADGRRLYATADNGRVYLFNTSNFTDTANVASGVSSPGAIAVDDYGWAWIASPLATSGTRSLVQIGTAPTFASITPTGGLASGGYTATITGSWFTPTTTAAFGVEANVGATVGTPGSNSMTVTVPPGATGTVDLILTNVAGPLQPLGITDTGSFTYIDPTPPPTNPPSPPRNVTASAGDASATVAWTAPALPGSFPVSNYAVTSSPGGNTCLTSTLTCTVTGLTNGTAYTFIVKALNGAGWSPDSSPSNAVTPEASATPSIVITGVRMGSEIRVKGTTSDLTGTVTPWVRFPGQADYTQGSARPTIVDNAFSWSRKANKKTHVYFTHDTVKSNTIAIPAR